MLENLRKLLLSSRTYEEIRLLDLLRAAASGNLRCRVRRATIGDMPSFISVSHVWGTGKAERLMHLDSGCGTKDVQISQNLESIFVGLLCHDSNTFPQLWNGSCKLPMWIDMVCINQSDMGEKASQIPLMREIYSQARSVIICINECDIFLRYAFQYLRQAARDNPATEENNPGIRFDPIGWDAIKRLMDCEWFHRKWVIQEAVIPKDAIFLCGADIMTMDDLFRGIDVVLTALLARPKAIKELYFAHVGSVRPVLALRELKRSYAKDQRQLNLLWMLENLRLTRATLAHDQIYALLGLCSPEEAAKNPIRYDLEPEEVYRTSAVSHAQLHNDLDFLGLCPSWVPNWHSKHLRRCLGLGRLDNEHQFFRASGAIPVDPTFKGNELMISGILVDRIKVLSDFCSPDRRHELSDANSKLFQQYFDFWMTPTGYPMPYKDDANQIETFARTISLLGIYLEPLPSPNELLEMFHRWFSGSALGEQLEQHGLGRNSAGQANGTKRFMRMNRLMSWEPFVTEQGYIGLAREKCSVGDEIWIIGGCNVPILLSPKAESPSHYEVRGEIFLDGFMFGEIMSTERVERRSIRRVTLV
ncbi:heterokaryon incompatibility protein-domain-containing protein [Halenospora varia]|nr:heterokaryon incompatibility protein-domain-containing protein [Halenospora varia]